MLDSFLIFAPVLLLPIVALLRFTGCHLVFGATPSDTAESVAVNCGGPSIDDAGVSFQKDDAPAGTEGSFFKSEGGQPFKLSNALVTDGNGNPVSEVYGTARVGTDMEYTFSSLVPGGFVATLKFAELGGMLNPGDRLFQFLVNGESSGPYNIMGRAGGALIAHDEEFLTQSKSGEIVIHFVGLDGTEALVNAIAVQRRDAVAIIPARAFVFAGGTQQFEAAANFDDAQFDWSVSGSGQIADNDATSSYTAPSGIMVPIRETVTVGAVAGNVSVQKNAEVFVYLRIDTGTKGAWVNRYGIDGFVLANTSPDTRLPSYVTDFTVRLTDNTPLNVASLGLQNTDLRVLTDSNGDARPPLVWNDMNGAHGITISFQFRDFEPHLFGVYCLDNGPDRRQRFTITQLDSGVIETVDSAIGTGTYLFWIGTGRIQIDVSKVPGSTGINNVVNAVFFR